jgi:chromosome segregation ATPase
MAAMRPPKPTREQLQLIKENDSLRTAIVVLRREIENKQGAVGRLETLLQERLHKIDELNGRLEQSREQVRRLDQECEHLADMIRIMPQLEAMLAPK